MRTDSEAPHYKLVEMLHFLSSGKVYTNIPTLYYYSFKVLKYPLDFLSSLYISSESQTGNISEKSWMQRSQTHSLLTKQ